MINIKDYYILYQTDDKIEFKRKMIEYILNGTYSNIVYNGDRDILQSKINNRCFFINNKDNDFSDVKQFLIIHMVYKEPFDQSLYYKNNREHILQQNKERYKTETDEQKQKRKDYYKKNRDKYREYYKQYYIEKVKVEKIKIKKEKVKKIIKTTDKKLEYDKEYREENKIKMKEYREKNKERIKEQKKIIL